MTIRNPILPGFNPDPSIVRAGDDYYIATSTFEWFPGVQIHHSRDLVQWELVAHPLTRLSQLNMEGVDDSGGVWAPCLTYSNGLFWLIYTNVKHHHGAFKVTHNYLVTASEITGPWSEPIYLNSSGFDPSLFHDDDGRKWLVNMDWEWRPNRNRFSGIILQEYDPDAQRLTGPIERIFLGTELGKTEGPHLYKREGYYYLLTAEGGTGFEHAVTMARSRSIGGPYEVDPENPILTSVGHSDATLERAGHADIVETPDGWYLVHLCSRPIGSGIRGRAEGWSVLGRETSIQKVDWSPDGWLRLAHGGNAPASEVPAPASLVASDAPARAGATGAQTGTRVFVDEFDGDSLSIHWQTLRVPLGEEAMSLSARPGYLRLFGQDPPVSRFDQSLIARRRQAFEYEAQTSLEFGPEDYKQMAGLICIYDTTKFHYLYVSAGELGRQLGILSAGGGEELFPIGGDEIGLPEAGPVHLRANVRYAELQFSWSSDGTIWYEVGTVLDMTVLSDEMRPGGSFTGAFVGVCCQDLSGLRRHADFKRFRYEEG
ncbi:MAG: glycoside hydrolase family 43 protein [Spirochaetota bacterium]